MFDSSSSSEPGCKTYCHLEMHMFECSHVLCVTSLAANYSGACHFHIEQRRRHKLSPNCMSLPHKLCMHDRACASGGLPATADKAGEQTNLTGKASFPGFQVFGQRLQPHDHLKLQIGASHGGGQALPRQTATSCCGSFNPMAQHLFPSVVASSTSS